MDTPVQQNLSNNNRAPSAEVTQPKKSHSVLPVILIILGIVETIWFSYYLITLIFITPKLSALYKDINVKQTTSPYLGVLLLAILVSLALAETFYGIWLNRLQRGQNELPIKHKKIVKIILALTILLFALGFVALIYSVVLPIYSLKSAF